MATLILTIVGPDRPGLVSTLSEAIAAHGGNWIESRMARLAGQFAGIVTIDADPALLAALPTLEQEGLRITATLTSATPPPTTGPRLSLDVVGNDRPGIIHDVSAVLASCGANIEELTTHVASGSFSGGALFRATILFRAPNDAALDTLKSGLERLGDEMMVDIRPPDM
jgi:glycine cleavage system regulatory protein